MNYTWQKIFIAMALVVFVIIQPGCKSQEEKMIDEGIKKFESADFAGAAKIYSEIIKKDRRNLIAYIKLASANACMHSDIKTFYRDLWTALESKNNIKRPLNFINEPFIIYQLSEDRPDGNVLKISDEVSAFTKAIKKNPDNSKLYFGRGLWNYVLSNQREAMDDFTTATRLDKNFIAAYIMKGKTNNAYLDRSYYNNFRTATKYYLLFDYKRALFINPQNSDIMLDIGDEYFNLQDHKSALKYYMNAYQADPQNYQALVECAQVETVIGNYIAAADYYKILVKKFPDNVSYLIELASRRILAGEKGEARINLEQAKAMTRDAGQYSLIQSIIEKNHLYNYK